MVSIGQFFLHTYDGHKWVGMACKVIQHIKTLKSNLCTHFAQVGSTLGQDVTISVGCLQQTFCFYWKHHLWLQELGDSTIYTMSIKNVSKK